MRAFLDHRAAERIYLEQAFEDLLDGVRAAFDRQLAWEKDRDEDDELPTPAEMLDEALDRDVDSELFPGFIEFLEALDREGFVISRPGLTSSKKSDKTRKPRIRRLAEV